jgi:hypothetical protein
MQYEVVVWRQGASNLKGLFTAVVIRLFEVESLEMRVSDSQGNMEEVDWDKGAIAVLAGGSNVRLSKNGKLVSLILTYKRRNAGDDPHDSIGPKVPEP